MTSSHDRGKRHRAIVRRRHWADACPVCNATFEQISFHVSKVMKAGTHEDEAKARHVIEFTADVVRQVIERLKGN